MAKFKKFVTCFESYIEDGIKFWTSGCVYPAIHHRDGSWSVVTNFGTIGAMWTSDEFYEHFTTNN